MSDPEKGHTKSRRRFLADMLFLGGGITAAAVLAKTVGGGEVAGQNAPPAATPTPKSCDMVPDGDMALPTEPVEPAVKGLVAPQKVDPPKPRGEVEYIPEPNPAGGARPVHLGDPAPQEEAQCEEPMIEGRTVAPKQ